MAAATGFPRLPQEIDEGYRFLVLRSSIASQNRLRA
jgi:hypothetical protein